MRPTTDELIDELHAVREKMLAEAGGTLAALVVQLRELESHESERVIPPPPAPEPRARNEVA
jgi:hypothetical protein